ncbi:HD domain-containing protein [Spirillospora sp. NPDC048911]|uniref:HD domain-containing protein n=1 Tax=Spirillospora sp. NPDC048911 TaxID=3364527 RepID=UPI00371390BF
MGGFLQLPTEIIGIGLAGPDIELIERAYAVAAYWHRDQRQKSGVPYIQHPAAVATIAARMSMGVTGVCAALLHDVISDTDCPAAELRREFGKQITGLVEGVTLWEATGSYSTTAELVDEPVQMLKLADRLHNMQTISYLPQDKRERRCQETLEFFVPLAAGNFTSSPSTLQAKAARQSPSHNWPMSVPSSPSTSKTPPADPTTSKPGYGRLCTNCSKTPFIQADSPPRNTTPSSTAGTEHSCSSIGSIKRSRCVS